jgi:hypothetical protein
MQTKRGVPRIPREASNKIKENLRYRKRRNYTALRANNHTALWGKQLLVRISKMFQITEKCLI